MQSRGFEQNNTTQSIIKKWFSDPLGQAFLATEKKTIEEILKTLYGNHLLILGESSFISCIKNSLIKHRVWLHPNAKIREYDCSAIRSRQDKLPIVHDEIHVVYLAHCLEFVKNPHEVLRESHRILIPEGYVILSGFNPWSLWGFYGLFAQLTKQWPWTGKFLSMTRLKDWLALLGFEVITSKYYFFRPPISFNSVLKHFSLLEPIGSFLWPFLGGSFYILARKRVIPLTPIKSLLNKKEKIAVEGLVEPTTRNS